MTTANEVVAYARSKLNQKVTVPTNPYGGQCVAFNDHIVQHFTNGKKNLAYTNAKDTLVKAAQQGLIVIYNDHPDKYPQPGDSIVYDWGTDPYGHIGIVIDAGPNGFHTLEQNVDGWRDENGNGQNDQLEIGGGGYVREMHRPASDYQYVTGWFRLKYDEPKPKEEKKKLPKGKGGTIMFVVKLMDDHDKKNKKGDFFLFNVLNKKYIHVSPAQYALIAPLITAGAIPEVKSYKVAPHFTAIVQQGKFSRGSWEQAYNGK